MDQHTLVITGMGAVTPVGIGVSNTYWAGAGRRKCGVGPITRFDASELPVQIAAEVKGFDPAAFMPKPLARTMAPLCSMPLRQERKPLPAAAWRSGGSLTAWGSSWARRWTA